MSPEQTSNLIRQMATTVYDGLRFNHDAVAVWHADIGHLTVAEAEAAFAAYRRDPQRGNYTPKPADILGQHLGSLPPERRRTHPDPVDGCGRCDHGWIDTVAIRHGTQHAALAPCPRCRPTTHERLTAGAYTPR
mgnify:FL=1